MGLWGISPQEQVLPQAPAADQPKPPEGAIWSEQAEPAAPTGGNQAESAGLADSSVGQGDASESASPSAESASPSSQSISP